jgi:hypothetical protein
MLNVTADGNVGILEDPNRAVNVTFSHQTANKSAVVIARVSRAASWPLKLYGLNVTCDVYIDSRANLSLAVHSGVGDIVMNTGVNVTLQNLRLETTTGSVDARLTKGVTIGGLVFLETTTGSVSFEMDEADVSGNISVSLRSTTGSVNVDLMETQQLSGNVTVNARTSTGSVNLSMEIDGDVGASIESSTVIGSINEDFEKFSGNETLLQSDNFPSGSNFIVNLRTSTGGINIVAVYEGSDVRS